MAIPGLALFYGGLVRSKNMLIGLDASFCDLLFNVSVVGYLWIQRGIFRWHRHTLGTNDCRWFWGSIFKWYYSGDSVSGTIPEFVFVTFQLTFAALTPALIVGGFAERIKFSGMLLFMTAWLTIVYLPICHMVWGGGLIAAMGRN